MNSLIHGIETITSDQMTMAKVPGLHWHGFRHGFRCKVISQSFASESSDLVPAFGFRCFGALHMMFVPRFHLGPICYDHESPDPKQEKRSVPVPPAVSLHPCLHDRTARPWRKATDEARRGGEEVRR